MYPTSDTVSMGETNSVSRRSACVATASFWDASLLLVIVAAGLVIGTILKDQKLRYCDNDASRWSTVYYLVEHGTYEFLPTAKPWWAGQPGKTVEELTPEQKEKWYQIGELYYSRPSVMPIFPTIDMVRLEGRYYSSKPPLLPTCLAGLVVVIQAITGQMFRGNPWVVIRTTLILTQVVPLLIVFWLLRGHLYRLTDSPFVRNFCMVAITLGTYLTPWSITLNNHVIAACTGLFALHAVLRIWYDGRREWYWFVLGGFFAAFTAGTELTAGLLAVCIFAALLFKNAKRTLLIGLPAALIPTVASLYMNYLVTGSFKPVYTQVNKVGGGYDYEGSYWRKPWGTDTLHEPKHIYLVNMLIGHHGVFSLTPVFVLSVFGMARSLVGRAMNRRLLAGFILLLTGVIIVVYTVKTHNYGGSCQGFRWLFWLIPFWLLFLPDGVEPFSRGRLGRAFCYALLAFSMLTVAFALEHPWPARSWMHALYMSFGWIPF